MCQRRRWTAEQFRLFLVEHPLVRHLTRRLLWGFITMKTPLSPVFAWQKTALTAMRRMSYSRCQQETSVYRMCWKSPESAAAFRQIYVDYELLPLSNSSNVVVTTLLITNVMSMNCHAGTDVSAGRTHCRAGTQRLATSGRKRQRLCDAQIYPLWCSRT